jgi:hypothetical protein
MSGLLLLNRAASRLRDPARRERVVAAVRAAPHLGGPSIEVVEATDPAQLVAAARSAIGRVEHCGRQGRHSGGRDGRAGGLGVGRAAAGRQATSPAGSIGIQASVSGCRRCCGTRGSGSWTSGRPAPHR